MMNQEIFNYIESSPLESFENKILSNLVKIHAFPYKGEFISKEDNQKKWNLITQEFNKANCQSKTTMQIYNKWQTLSKKCNKKLCQTSDCESKMSCFQGPTLVPIPRNIPSTMPKQIPLNNFKPSTSSNLIKSNPQMQIKLSNNIPKNPVGPVKEVFVAPNPKPQQQNSNPINLLKRKNETMENNNNFDNMQVKISKPKDDTENLLDVNLNNKVASLENNNNVDNIQAKITQPKDDSENLLDVNLINKVASSTNIAIKAYTESLEASSLQKKYYTYMIENAKLENILLKRKLRNFKKNTEH